MSPVPLDVNPETPAVAVAVHAKVVPPTFEVRFTGKVFPPEHTVCVSMVFVTTGTGLTSTVYVATGPAQEVGVGPIGVIVYVTVPWVVPKVDIVWTGMVAPPLAANPITSGEAVAVQLNVVPATADVRVTREVVPPEQIVCVNGVFDTVGRALTVTTLVNVLTPQGEVILTLYVPLFNVVTFDIEGFWVLGAANPFGPVQSYLFAPVVTERFSVVPSHSGELALTE
jgi:hypothetical protein